MKFQNFLSVTIASTVVMTMTAQPVKLHIVGEIDTVGHYTELGINRQNGNFRKLEAMIPVVDGKIDYVFETSELDRFSVFAVKDLTQRGSWYNFPFMAEDGEIKVSGKMDDGLLRMNMESAIGTLNQQLLAYDEHKNLVYRPRHDSINAILDQTSWDDYYSPEGKKFWDDFKLLSAKINERPDSLALLEQRNAMYHKREEMEAERTMYTPAYYALLDQQLAVTRDQFEEDMQKYGTADSGLFALSMLIEWFNRDDAGGKDEIIDAYYAHYREPYANTLMGQRMDELVVGYEVSHVGGRYPDYALPDANGNVHRIKDLISGKLALVDLWGSTCSPCRVNSMSMKPIYEDYHDRGFEIIGIAREYHNLDLFRKAIEKDGYPWLQLIELDDAHGIFNLHGIPNAMGGTYLVSPEGRILLISPTPEELRTYLESWYTSK